MTGPMTPTDTDPTLRPRCTATSSRTGERCKAYPVHGATVCVTHGGAAPQVRAAAARRVLEAQINGELTTRGWEPVVDPVAMYADAAGEAWAFKELAREHLNLLNEWVLTIGGYDAEDGFSAVAEQARATVTTYERALDRVLTWLDRMTQRGLDAEAIRHAKARPSRDQAEFLMQVLTVAFTDDRVSVEGEWREVVAEAMIRAGVEVQK